jgi:DnaJ-class molecular chaperone
MSICARCNGKGSITCPACDGRGVVQDDQLESSIIAESPPHPPPCPECRGRGMVVCPDCEASGEVDDNDD